MLFTQEEWLFSVAWGIACLWGANDIQITLGGTHCPHRCQCSMLLCCYLHCPAQCPEAVLTKFGLTPSLIHSHFLWSDSILPCPLVC
jgi:hypothetical protein